jgi:tRNA nucleotidyltransferase/poly(A) polymerase
MADYIYLLENRLSKAQQASLNKVREVARAKGLTIFLVGGAVRDLTSGSPVRDLDVVVQGNALKLKKDIEKAGGVITGENEAGQSLFVRFPGGARMEIGSTLSVNYPKPGKPVVKPATILEDLRRRDFTANAMALSLNDGSYGLLMDPLNGVADIENRELRLVSNYGFIEDPVRMIRAARYMARLGWQMDEKTQARYETGKQEGYISAMDAFHRGYETEEIFHEEDPLRVLKRLEAEGWMKHLFPALSAAKANVAELERLRESQTQLQMQGIHPEAAVANFPLLTAKMAPKDVATLKKTGVCEGDRSAGG